MKQLTIILFTLLLILTSCNSSNVLNYKNKRHFTESNNITVDSTFNFFQNTFYNKPGILDEEHCHILKLTLLDTTAAKTKKILSLQSDTNIIKAEYDVFSIWNWTKENNDIYGQIEIVSWNNNGIILKEDISIIDHRRNENLNYKGTREFIIEYEDIH